MASGVSVMDIRIGEHPGKTRIVLDASGKAAFTADLDNQEKILVIEISGVGWSAAMQQTLSASPLVSSYRVETMDGGGTMLIVQLKRAAVISYKGTMDDAATGGQRLIIDLTAAP
jgi:N-acetylmuramoyl-L-alanine amidase